MHTLASLSDRQRWFATSNYIFILPIASSNENVIIKYTLSQKQVIGITAFEYAKKI